MTIDPNAIVDCHLHLQEYPSGTDVESLITEATAAGVTRLVCNGTCERDWQSVLDLSDEFLQVIPCLGLHPWFVSGRSSSWFTRLERMVAGTSCGIGEIGLDKLAESFDAAAQEKVFRTQLNLARKYHRPVTIHCVKAYGWLMDVLDSEPELPAGLLIRAYSGSVEMVKTLVAKGAYISFSGNVLSPNYKKAREAIQAVPLDRLLLETDSPNMLPPEGYRTHIIHSSDGKELNHPANLAAIVGGVAKMLGEDPNRLITRLWLNAQKLFGSLFR